MSDDIVARLRIATLPSVPCVKREAADEIERLRKEHDEAEPLLKELWERRTEATEMRAEIERLRVIVQGWEHSARNAERDMATLRAERDEARRIICQDESYNHKSGVTPREVAIDRGWDCFKEPTNA